MRAIKYHCAARQAQHTMAVLYITRDTLFIVFKLWISLSNMCLVKTVIILAAFLIVLRKSVY